MRRAARWWWAAYLILLVASHLTPRAASLRHEAAVVLPGSQDRPAMQIAYHDWPASQSTGLPVVFIHGSPGSGGDFSRLGPLLAASGRRALAPDLPGYGESEPDPPSMSMESGARAVLGLMTALGIERAHIVGWSLGGGVGLHIADSAPDRLASLTLMASIGDQRFEGSGSYLFEHVKYAVGWGLAWGARNLVPHFGALDWTRAVQASMRGFWDSDQRPLRAIMERLTVPTMILHGRHDFLVRARTAEHHHTVIGSSRLVMLDASHFLPFLQAEETSRHLGVFLARHDQPGIVALRQATDLSPVPAPLFGSVQSVFTGALDAAPWWLMLALCTLLVAWRDRFGASLVALITAAGRIDLGIALAGIILAQALRAARARRHARGREVIGAGVHARTLEDWRRLLGDRPVRTAFASRLTPGAMDAAFAAHGASGRLHVRFFIAAAISFVLWAVFYAILAAAAYGLIVLPLARSLGATGFLVGAVIALAAPRLVTQPLTRTGRRMARTSFSRTVRREFWPAWAMYLLLAPHFARLWLRHRSLTAWLGCNPGIGACGGVVGESKSSIMDGLSWDGSPALSAAFIDSDPSPTDRARIALDALAARPELGGFPVILKPDVGERGFGVRIARRPEDINDYFRSMTAPAMLQRYHPGPHECGILWARRPGGEAGFIFAVTRKDFPVLEGDGRRTLEELIHAHPRFHAQAGVFLERFARDRSRILGAGERLRLAEAGNHCQGTLFRDGADLATPALESRIDAVARRYAGGGKLDIGRFDIRYESDERLRAGEGFAIIELNGTTGEPTNIYDPQRSLGWALGVLAAQWDLISALADERRRTQRTHPGIAQLYRDWRNAARRRSGPSVAD